MMPNVFDYINSINSVEKIDIFREDRYQSEKDYVPYIVNRGLSYFPDTIMYANEVNRMSLIGVEKVAQFDFYRLTIRSRKRISKWWKAEKNDDLEIVKKYYGYSNQKAVVALKLLSKDQIQVLRDQLQSTGGRI